MNIEEDRRFSYCGKWQKRKGYIVGLSENDLADDALAEEYDW